MFQNLLIISIIVLAVVFLIKRITKGNCNGCKKNKKDSSCQSNCLFKK
ncbi:MAG: hypothetical protein LBC22_03945 [Endomicrobium sp.]|nr:hypothetical protein [Endomicrobium sp.]